MTKTTQQNKDMKKGMIEFNFFIQYKIAPIVYEIPPPRS